MAFQYLVSAARMMSFSGLTRAAGAILGKGKSVLGTISNNVSKFFGPYGRLFDVAIWGWVLFGESGDEDAQAATVTGALPRSLISLLSQDRVNALVIDAMLTAGLIGGRSGDDGYSSTQLILVASYLTVAPGISELFYNDNQLVEKLEGEVGDELRESAILSGNVPSADDIAGLDPLSRRMLDYFCFTFSNDM